MPFRSARFSQRCLNCRENNGEGGKNLLTETWCFSRWLSLLHRHSCASNPPALPSINPRRLGPAVLQWLASAAPGQYLRRCQTPPLRGSPCPTPGAGPTACPDPPALAKPREKLGRCSTDTPGERGALVLNPNKPPGLVLGTLPGILLVSVGSKLIASACGTGNRFGSLRA